jgi:hypothetical protein
MRGPRFFLVYEPLSVVPHACDREERPMTVRYGPRFVNPPQAQIWIPSRSLLLVLSGTVRKCKKEGMRARISKWVRKWRFSATARL